MRVYVYVFVYTGKLFDRFLLCVAQSKDCANSYIAQSNDSNILALWLSRSVMQTIWA